MDLNDLKKGDTINTTKGEGIFYSFYISNNKIHLVVYISGQGFIINPKDVISDTPSNNENISQIFKTSIISNISVTINSVENEAYRDFEEEGYQFGKYIFEEATCYQFDLGVKRAWEDFVSTKGLQEIITINGKKYNLVSE